MLFRTCDLLVGQRTQLVNALRGHLAEHGIILGKRIGNIYRLAKRLEEDEDLPALIRDMGRLYLDQIAGLSAEIDKLDARIAAAAKESDVARKLQTMPGIASANSRLVCRATPAGGPDLKLCSCRSG